MKLKGAYSSETSYNVGDVVTYTDGHVYHLQRPCSAGVPPVDTLFWGMLSQTLEQCVLLIMDGMDLTAATVEAKIPKNIDGDSISLTSGDHEYLITVDATGETPELAVELIEEEGGD